MTSSVPAASGAMVGRLRSQSILSRSSSWGFSFSSNSMDIVNLELDPWKNPKKEGREQDEVWRKREEMRVLRDKMAEKAWRQFWE